MIGGFDKFKKKIIKEHCIKSIIYSLCLSLGLTSVLLIILKLSAVELHFAIYIVIGAVLSGILFYLIYTSFMPSDEYIARRLDRTLSLNEKTQTMVKYQDKTGTIVEMQRKNTLEILTNTSLKALPMKFAMSMFICIFLSSGLLTSSILVPQRKVHADVIDVTTSSEDNESVTTSTSNQDSTDQDNSEILDKIDEIKDQVDKSELDEELKEDIKQELDDLKDKIENGEDKDQAIDDTKEDIEEKSNEANSKNKIGEELEKSLDSEVSTLGTNIKSLDIELVNASYDQMSSTLQQLTDEELINRLELLINEINTALSNSGVDTSDDLYNILSTLADDLSNIKDQLVNNQITNEEAYQLIIEAFDKVKQDSDTELEEQKKTEQTIEEILLELEQMKDSSTSTPPEENEGEDEPSEDEGDKEKEDEGENKDDNSSEGGSSKDPNGEGEIVYGSNDEIYSKDGTSGEYGEVIDDYYSNIIDDGEGDSDIGDIIDDYFSTLYGSGKSGDGE